MSREAATVIDRLKVKLPRFDAPVALMSGGQRQSIAIARAVTWGESLVIMDEPTAALGVRETAAVERLIRSLRDQGVTVLLISHDLDQVMRVSDTVVVLRRGRAVARRSIGEVDGDQLVGLITGTISGDE